MEMSRVDRCMAADCAYNSDSMCHAMASTVGKRQGPACDTFMQVSDEEAGKCVSDETGGVGACKMADCQFNECLHCGAESVSVMMRESRALCGTFARA